jgi:hypothetical protein
LGGRLQVVAHRCASTPIRSAHVALALHLADRGAREPQRIVFTILRQILK